MANIARFDPFNDIVDDLFRGFFVRPAPTFQFTIASTHIAQRTDICRVRPGTGSKDIAQRRHH